MRVLLQRVDRASVSVDGTTKGKIQKGLMLLFGVESNPKLDQLDWLCKKVLNLRVFKDQNDKMNLSVLDIQGEILVISQFTLYAYAKKGTRPSYTRSAPAVEAETVYNLFLEKLELGLGKPIQSGVFGANMDVDLLNQGPVTIMLDTEQKDF